MVKVRREQPLLVDGSINLETWLSALGEARPELSLARLREACEFSLQAEEKALSTTTIWAEGHSSYRMGLEMVEILNELRVDEDGLVAALVYRAVRENQLTLNHVRKLCGDNVARLIEGVMKMAAISDVQFGTQKVVLGERKDQLEQARQLVVSLVDDVRVVLLKLAERTCRIRTAVKNTSSDYKKLAKEVVEIYAPLAHRLGIGHLRWELEDLAFRLREPIAYRRIAKLLDEKRTFRQEYIGGVVTELEKQLSRLGIECVVEGRPKHIFSIWKKMDRKGIPFSEVYDVRAVRILVDHVDDCYRALGIVHNLWRNIPDEFDDYIANPKENGYRSLHTAVIGPEGKVLEVQIRTDNMQEEAEYGVCSHWRYKGDGSVEESESYSQRLDWLRQIVEHPEEDQQVSELLGDLSVDRIYVFTPEGDVVDMNPGATPIDFAYRVHTEVGHKCRGARINGRVVPLNSELKSGDHIEIIVGEDAEPRREWLHQHLGYVATSRARLKIQSWFGRREKEKNIVDGKRVLVDELSQVGLENCDFSQLVEQAGFESANDLFYAIAVGDLAVVEIVEAAAELVSLELSSNQLDLGLESQTEQENLIIGQGDLPYSLAVCCQPVPGDLILGIVNETDLLAVHREDCLQVLKADVHGRMMQLEWRDVVEVTFPVTVEIIAYDRFGLLHDITRILMLERTNVQSISTSSDKSNNRVSIRMVLEVSQLNRLLQTLERIERLPNVLSARRSIATFGK
jgi:GTP pyrophosphokinase